MMCFHWWIHSVSAKHKKCESSSKGNSKKPQTEWLDNKTASEMQLMEGTQLQPHICSDGPQTGYYQSGEKSQC